MTSQISPSVRVEPKPAQTAQAKTAQTPYSGPFGHHLSFASFAPLASFDVEAALALFPSAFPNDTLPCALEDVHAETLLA